MIRIIGILVLVCGMGPGAWADPAAVTSVVRGRYLAALCGCAGCHTPWGMTGRDNTRLFAGTPGRPGIKGGESIPNITPDPETGIGRWTDDQIVAAIREGKRADGAPLSEHMPAREYHWLTDDDARALVAYLRTVPAVVNKVPRAPANTAHKAKLLNLGPAKGNVDDVTDPVRHGAYIVAMMRCIGCHTPRKGSLAGRPWVGGVEFALPAAMGGGKFYSANLTGDPATGLGSWKIEDVIAAVRELIRPDGSKVHGPMTAHKDDYALLTDADAHALGAYIKAIPPVVNKVPAPKTVLPGSVQIPAPGAAGVPSTPRKP